MNILGIDFETAHGFRQIFGEDEITSAACSCGIALADTKKGELVITDATKIRPEPFEMDENAYAVHGLSLEDLRNAPTFDYAYLYWMKSYLEKAEILIAHNSNFDMTVLVKAMKYYGLKVPDIRYTCTLEMSRKAFPGMKHKLDAMCSRYGIPLDHHNSKSDAMAAATLFIKLIAEGRSYPTWNLRDL